MIDDGGEWWFGCGMKAKLFALFIALLMVGWGEDAKKEAVQDEEQDCRTPPGGGHPLYPVAAADQETRLCTSLDD